ncbi:hypothetical protein CDL12_04568 [Handroanthus impetiginosus]|uniref:Uncharacterized protein n=1 Tax=Handroanthus impetiginosus TaxID=429701 RepID=A0A2G9HYX0_9LAMI|nr:hypothetical protein CDL12_04568 [Handroanthus impetiginosus]
MASSLHKLLSEEGVQQPKSGKLKKKVKFKERNGQEESIRLPIYICHDRRSFDSSFHRSEMALSLKSSSVFSSRRGGSGSERSNTPRRDEPTIDDVAIKAMVSILTGYIGQYLRDKSFRQSIREKCRSCFETSRKKHSDNEIFAHMEIGIQTIERLVESQDIKKEMDLESLQKSIKILNIVASLDSTQNSYLSACAHLYLSIVYKIAKNDKISAKHLLGVFGDSPFLARTHLLPELWEHFFLPHLLHLKIWYNKELDFLASSGYSDKEKKIKALNEQYNDRMDSGTSRFALYYKEWLKVGSRVPSIPSVPLPSKASYARTRRKSLESSTSNGAISNKSLYQAVFGPIVKGRSMDLDKNGASKNVWDLEGEEEVEEDIKHCNYIEKKAVVHRRSSSQSCRIQRAELWSDSQKSDYFRFLGCRNEPTESFVQGHYISSKEKIKYNDETNEAIATLCSSRSLSDCEMAIRAVSEAWLNSQTSTITETLLSQASVIQGIMEVLYMSNDDEILELGISILAELVNRSEINRQFILSSDPQLDVSVRLLRSSSLFLKAAALLYLLKPKARQMISMEWIPLVLRVLEFGDQFQTLFTVRCSPHEAAYYLLDQLLTGFDEDKNLENARQIIALGGLSLLVRRMEVGDISEKSKITQVLLYCIQADGSCRHYLAKNLKKEIIISILVLGKQTNLHKHALGLLTELLCLSRRDERLECLTGLMKGWDCLNMMNVLLVQLQRAQPEERPIIAVVLLQLDLMGDPSTYSVYREEAIDAIVKALDCLVFDEKVQEVLARALLILGGHFSYTGEPEIERRLLKKAGLNENVENSLHGKDISIDGHINLHEEDKTRENWQRKAAVVLLTSGNRRLLTALSDSIANSIPCLARASLITVCWMSIELHSHGDKDLQLAACSILAPQLIECLNDKNANFAGKILASFSLYSLTKGTDYLSGQSRLETEVLDCLHKLSRVTWTAEEMILLMTNNSSKMLSLSVV